MVSVNRISTGQIALWHALMQMDNKCGWREWFTVSGMALELTSGLSRQGILKARNALKQLGLLEFRTNGTRATAYRLIPPTTVKGIDTGGEQERERVEGRGGCQDGGQRGAQRSGTLDKQDKTKLEREIKERYGEFENVELTAEQVAELQRRFADWKERIERLSAYMASAGRQYKDHYATLLSWARRETADGAAKPGAQTRAGKPEIYHSGRYDYGEIERAAAKKLQKFSGN